ncbi:MAG TPA: flavoprotein [Thermomicrobiales bacterium]|nr:flavoprotein [Thermomicrobiales bacterium]
MSNLEMTYMLISGASTARRTPDLIKELAEYVPFLLTVLTPNAHQVVSPRELALVPGHQIIESFFDEAILPRPDDGVVLIAPCTFNTLNKLSQGIADNLPLSIAAEAIGRGTPVIVAVSVNAPLWEHPRAKGSVETLRSWGVQVIEPVADENGYLTMAEDNVLVEAVRRALSTGTIISQ